MKLNESKSISCPPESIWAYWMDVANDANWRSGVIKAEWTSPPPHGVGSKGKHTTKGLGVITWEVTGFDDGRCFEFIHTTGKFKGTTAIFTVEPENDGSRVIMRAKMSGSVPMRLMMLFMGNMARKGLQRDLKKLKGLME